MMMMMMMTMAFRHFFFLKILFVPILISSREFEVEEQDSNRQQQQVERNKERKKQRKKETKKERNKEKGKKSNAHLLNTGHCCGYSTDASSQDKRAGCGLRQGNWYLQLANIW